MADPDVTTRAEQKRLEEDRQRLQNWKRWGPYLAERQWGTLREDYSEDGESWTYFPHDHARSRAYRWGEDGLLGICDRQARLCFALALWNENDPILKERLFGLTNPEGNHGEDVKEHYFYLDSTPTHSYMTALYKYPQSEFPYAQLLEENRARGVTAPEFELEDTGVFADERYFDVFAEYAKAAPEDVLIRIRIINRGPEHARLHLLPTLWFRNTWSWDGRTEHAQPKPRLERSGAHRIDAHHGTLGHYVLLAEPHSEAQMRLVLTENETNRARVFGEAAGSTPAKDAFHSWLIEEGDPMLESIASGTKAAFHQVLELGPGEETCLRLRLLAAEGLCAEPFGAEFDQVFAQRRSEADAFYERVFEPHLDPEERAVTRQAYAGLLWSKQFYYFDVRRWLEGDPGQPPPPPRPWDTTHRDWRHLYNRDVISVPDKWEYPWYAAWDLAFHMIPLAHVDPHFAKEQLLLLLREWYMHPNGQIPAYEFAFSDTNPPVHAWAAWRVYKMTGPRGQRDIRFLGRVFHKLLINFTWWINQRDPRGRNLFAGGFLGLDNIGVFDRSKPLPTGGMLEQADATGWMAFYCSTMLSMALELATHDPAYEDVASKFFEHYVSIADAMNSFGGTGLWDPEDGFYYDRLLAGEHTIPLKVRSIVGLIPLISCEVLDTEVIDRMPAFRGRLEWFMAHRQDLHASISWMESEGHSGDGRRLLGIPSRERLERVLAYLFDENEFLSPHGIRSLSRIHREQPYVFETPQGPYRVEYDPGESRSKLFGGNSNWRGPVWLPINYLLVEALERYHHFYGDGLRVECPTGSGRYVNLSEAAAEIDARVARLFLHDEAGRRPSLGDGPLSERFQRSKAWHDLVLFHEYFHGDSGEGLGASHQTGWTALAVRFIAKAAQRRYQAEAGEAQIGVPCNASNRLARLERRAEQARYRDEFVVLVRAEPEGPAFACELQDVSHGGLAISAPDVTLEVGDSVVVQLPLGRSASRIQTRCEVLEVNDKKAQLRLRFLDDAWVFQDCLDLALRSWKTRREGVD